MTLTFVDPIHAAANADARRKLNHILDDMEREEMRDIESVPLVLPRRRKRRRA